MSNDYAGAVPENPTPADPARFLLRRAAAYRAFYEHMPLRRAALPGGADLRLYRRFDFGRLARFNILDTRQYRTDQPAGSRLQPAGPKLQDPAGTILGKEQLQWLFDGLVRWARPFSRNLERARATGADGTGGSCGGADVVVDVDKQAGYEFERRRVRRHFREAGSLLHSFARDPINPRAVPQC